MPSFTRKHAVAFVFILFALLPSCAHGPREGELYGGRRLIEWNTLLRGGESVSETSAALRDLARESPETVRAVVEALRATNLNEDERRAAADVLGEMAREDRSIVRALVGALKDSSPTVRAAAGDALWKAAPADPTHLPKLLEDLKCPEADVRLYAAQAIGKMQRDEDRTMVGEKGALSAAGEAMRQALRDPDRHVRQYAALAFAKAPREPKGVFDELKRLLDDDYVPARAAAVEALWAFPSMAPKTAPLLIRFLRDPHPEIVRSAAKVYEYLGEKVTIFQDVEILVGDEFCNAAKKDPAFVPLLSRLIANPDPAIRLFSAKALGFPGPYAAGAVVNVIAALRDEEALVCLEAIKTLGAIGPAARAAIPALVDVLANPDVDARESAAGALACIAMSHSDKDERNGPTPAEIEKAVSALARALVDENERVRDLAVSALGTIGPRAAPAVPAIAKALRDRDSSVRQSAAKTLGRIGAGAGMALPALIAAAADPDKYVRIEMIKTLHLLGGQSEEILSVIQKALGDADEAVAHESAWALARAGRIAFSLLLDSLQDGNAGIRLAAARGLGRLAGQRMMDPDGYSYLPYDEEDFEEEAPAQPRLTEDESRRTISALLAAIEDADAGVREAACGTLGAVGSRAAVALPTFIRALDDAAPDVRRLAAWGIEGLGTAAKDALLPLLRAIRDDNEAVRRHAIQALGRVAPGSTEVIPPLIEALEDSETGRIAVDVLGREGAIAAPALAAALRSPNPIARGNAADALRSIGPDAVAAAGPALVEALDDPDEDVRSSAARAIENVRPDAEAAVPALMRAFHGDARESVAAALSIYAGKARAAIPALREALKRTTRDDDMCFLRQTLLRAIESIGADEETVKTLLAIDVSDDRYLVSLVFRCLLDHPAPALDYLRRHDDILSLITPTFDCLTHMPQIPSVLRMSILRMLRRADPAWRELQRAVIDDPRLSPGILAALGDPRNLPLIRNRMAGASEHELSYLKACARALGDPPDRVVRISETATGDFRPASASPGGDKRRMPRGGGGHFHSDVDVLITGRLVMPDETPAVEPTFFYIDDCRMPDYRRREPAPVAYDPRMGRFQFFTIVPALFRPGYGPREEGPYQTGSALVLIEARGAKPLKVQFFDEMPEVEITLSALRH